MRLPPVPGSAFLAFLVLAGAAPPLPAAPTPLVMQLDWIANVQFAGLFQAEARGLYRDAGLDVRILESDPQQKTVDAVLAGPLIVGSAESNVLLRARADGRPVVALATMFQGSPIGWMYLKRSGIRRIEDLAGRRIGIHPDGEYVIEAVFAERGLERGHFNLPHVGYDIAILLRGEVDAMQGYEIDEFVKLRMAVGDEAGMFAARDFGYAAYSQVFFTSEGRLASDGAAIRAFLDASRRGWEHALAHPGETVDLVLARRPDLDREYQLRSLEAIAGLVRSPDGAVMAPMRREVWETSLRNFLAQGLLERPVDLDGLLPDLLRP